MMHPLGTPKAEELSTRADQIESRVNNPANHDDPKWLLRWAGILRRVAAKKEKAFAQKQMRRAGRRT